ncbi:MAG: hypothetical protein AAF081_01895 [Actinomycetota bacterium]
MSRPSTRPSRRVAAAVASGGIAALLLAGCGTATPAAETAAPMVDPVEPDLTDSIAQLTAADDGSRIEVARERCLAAPAQRDRAYEERGGDDEDDDEPELTDEELAQTYAPEFPTVDGVAPPDERPTLTPITPFDLATAGFDELDLLIGFCIENDVVSEAELFGEDEGDDEWCDELAGFPIEEVREFAAEDGEDVVREEFEACGLPNPLDS